ncbi:MAG: hypothetical protein NXH95_00700 [Pseudomonadaceae bacterium]|nr:hypothetical protein [Pseudomonadaceae bacterium]
MMTDDRRTKHTGSHAPDVSWPTFLSLLKSAALSLENFESLDGKKTDYAQFVDQAHKMLEHAYSLSKKGDRSAEIAQAFGLSIEPLEERNILLAALIFCCGADEPRRKSSACKKAADILQGRYGEELTEKYLFDIVYPKHRPRLDQLTEVLDLEGVLSFLDDYYQKTNNEETRPTPRF